jgi:amidase
MARSAADAAIVLRHIAGRDPRDPTSLGAAVPDYAARIGEGVDGVRLGIDWGFIGEGSDPEIVAVVEAAVETLEACGMRPRNVSIPSPRKLIDDWTTLCAAEAAVAHRATYPAQAELYGPELAALLDHGLRTTGAAVAEVGLTRLAYGGALEALFDDADLLILPVAGRLAPHAGGVGEMVESGLYETGRYTAPLDMTGHPTITLPGGFERSGVPIGFQLIGRHLGEELLFRAAHAFQQRTDWHSRHPML